jgi:hypothetical protein
MRRALLAVQLVALAVGLAGCGGDTLSLDPVADAATKTTQAGSSRVAFQMTMKGGAQTFSFDAEGIFAYDEQRGSLTMDLSSVVPGSGEAVIELRMLDSMLYMRMPDVLAGSGVLPQGKRWIGFDLDKTLEAAGLGPLDLSQLQQDPSETLGLLRASSTEVEKAGKADVRGVETTRYTASLDLRKAIEATAGELGLSKQQTQELRRAAETLMEQAGVARVPVDVFVDDAGLLRRMAMNISTSIDGKRVAMKMLTDYFDFGVEVDVHAPPAGQVFDLTDAFASGAGQD